MLIISNFKHSLEVEEALAVLEKKGIPKNSMMMVMMESEKSKPVAKLTQPLEQTTLPFEIGMACGTAASVFGISIGFLLAWGPIIWGLITAVTGFFAASGVTLWVQSASNRNILRKKTKRPELTLIIRCGEEHLQMVYQVLWHYQAMSIGRVNEVSS
jgi:hypothetical protein